MTDTKNLRYVWFDTEYSDLELESAVLLEVAAIITDGDLRRIVPAGRDVRLAVRLDKEARLSAWVEENLQDLLTACRSPEAVILREADDRLCSYVDAITGFSKDEEIERPILAGNSVHADWWLLRRFLPGFAARLHYRHLDVTSFKLEWKRIHPNRGFDKKNRNMVAKYFPEAVLPDTAARHDAYYDAQTSIAELAYYRKHLLHVE